MPQMQAPTAGRVLFIAPPFFGYERDMAEELRRRGYAVDELRDRPFDTPLMHAVTRYARGAMIGAADRLYRRQLEAYGRSAYDLVLVVNGQTLSEATLRQLRAAYPGAAFVLYLWDSLANRRSVVRNLPSFDACLTFDAGDAREYGLRFRPLFYGPRFTPALAGTQPKWDVSFVGTAHTDRYAVVRRVSAAIGASPRRYWYLYLQAPWVYYANKVVNPALRGARRREFAFTPLSKAQLADVYRQSAAVLDIEHPRQTGLTARPFETLGSEKKLITTSARVREYEFFDARNIHVIDRARVTVPADFLRTPYMRPPSDVYARYSVAGWLDEVLNAAAIRGAGR